MTPLDGVTGSLIVVVVKGGGRRDRNTNWMLSLNRMLESILFLKASNLLRYQPPRNHEPLM